MKFKLKHLYDWMLHHKLLSICVLFTVFTMLDTIPILMGLWPPKQGINAYVHLLGRLAIQSILIFGLYLFDTLKKRFQSGILVYIGVFVLTWGMLMLYLILNSLFTPLHPDAFRDATRSYIFLYLMLGIVIGIKAIVMRKLKSKEA